jgi:hypothetical protein
MTGTGFHRPTLGIAVTPGAPAPLGLLGAMLRWCRVVAWCPDGGPRDTRPPDALLVTDPAAPLRDVAQACDLPVAVVVDDLADATASDVAIVRTTTPGTPGLDAIALPAAALRASAHPPITPFVRSRWRASRGLAPDLIARVGAPEPWPTADVDIPTALALAAAAAVRGPWLATALALGTPVVTTGAEAARIGAEPGVAVLVADSAAELDAALRALVADVPRATALGWGARMLVEQSLDLDTIAVEILDRLGIGPAAFPMVPLASLDAELAALGTPTWSSVRVRALARVAPVTGVDDHLTLTGSSR